MDAILHLLPFHISASGTKATVRPRMPLAVYPTATQAVADVHETPANCVTVAPLAALYTVTLAVGRPPKVWHTAKRSDPEIGKDGGGEEQSQPPGYSKMQVVPRPRQVFVAMSLKYVSIRRCPVLHETPCRTNRRVIGFPNPGLTVSFEQEAAICATLSLGARVPLAIGASRASTKPQTTTPSTTRGARMQARAPNSAT